MSNLLLDTQVALWALEGSSRLQPATRERMLRGGDAWIFYQASTWEIQIKHPLGKLPLPCEPANYLHARLRACGWKYSQLQDTDIFFLANLPLLRRDPFDRLLIAHAIVHGWTLVTADENLL